MAIDKSGKWWVGGSTADLADYLKDFGDARGDAVAHVAHSTCAACHGDVFGLRIDDDEGCAERTCSSCGAVTLMLDSAEYADDAELEECA